MTCEGNTCDSLVLLMFGAIAAVVFIIVVVSVALSATVSTVLERRGWPIAKRRATAGVYVVGAELLLLVVALVPVSTGFAGFIAWVVVLASIPLAIWQRRATRRWRVVTRQAQSSPCSTA
jgi:hypothetical protein